MLFDIWSPEQRGMAMVGYAIAVVGGPTIAPVIGGAITSSYLRWRWTEYLTGILMLAQLIVNMLVLDESYTPALLVYKAQRLRYETGNWALHAKVSLATCMTSGLLIVVPARGVECFAEGIGGKVSYPAHPDVYDPNLLPHLPLLRLRLW